MHFIEYIFHSIETHQPSGQIPPMFSQHTHKSLYPSHLKKQSNNRKQNKQTNKEPNKTTKKAPQKCHNNKWYSKASTANQLIHPGRSAFIEDRWKCGLILEKTSQASCWQWWSLLTLGLYYWQCPAFSCSKRKHRHSETSGAKRKRILKRTDPQYLPQAEQTSLPQEVLISRA